MKTPLIKNIDITGLVHTASCLLSNGKLAVSDNNLVYLDVDDAYIHQLFPLLKDQEIKKPDYFGEKSAGAHITVIYPEEKIKVNKGDLNQKHGFLIKNIASVKIDLKTYYVLLVESSSLLQIRRKYNLPDLLCFKGYSIGLHITIGVKV